jgi:starch synthase
MKILFVSPEIAPFAKTGGLADVAQALPAALQSLGEEVRAVMPKYRSVSAREHGLRFVTAFSVPMRGGLQGCDLWQSDTASVTTYFLGNEAYFNREDYYGRGAWNYPDNLERFLFFCKAALDCCKAVGFAPDVIHCNDWQTAALPALLTGGAAAYREDAFFLPLPGLVYTIHNIAYQGRFPEDQWPLLCLPRGYYSNDFEFYGQINLTKGAIHLSDAVTTVSRTYAREIRTTDFGFGLQPVLQRHEGKLSGILNGVDYRQWRPEDDPYLYGMGFSADDLSGKRHIKSRLRAEYQLPDADGVPLIGLVSRFVEQKGIDLIAQCAEQMVQHGAQLIALGSGEPRYHDFFEWLHRAYPDRVGIYIGFHEALAHRIEAAADIFLMPSLFEPCGLNQIYSLRYGTLPVVRETGGLADTIRDGVNGFTFFDFNRHYFFDAVRRAIDLFRDRPDQWRQMMITAMRQDFSWEKSAANYLDVYRGIARGQG